MAIGLSGGLEPFLALYYRAMLTRSPDDYETLVKMAIEIRGSAQRMSMRTFLVFPRGRRQGSEELAAGLPNEP